MRLDSYHQHSGCGGYHRGSNLQTFELTFRLPTSLYENPVNACMDSAADIEFTN